MVKAPACEPPDKPLPSIPVTSEACGAR